MAVWVLGSRGVLGHFSVAWREHAAPTRSASSCQHQGQQKKGENNVPGKAGGSTLRVGLGAGGKIRVLRAPSTGHPGAGACQPRHAVAPTVPAGSHGPRDAGPDGRDTRCLRRHVASGGE